MIGTTWPSGLPPCFGLSIPQSRAGWSLGIPKVPGTGDPSCRKLGIPAGWQLARGDRKMWSWGWDTEGKAASSCLKSSLGVRNTPVPEHETFLSRLFPATRQAWGGWEAGHTQPHAWGRELVGPMPWRRRLEQTSLLPLPGTIMYQEGGHTGIEMKVKWL